MGNSQSFSSPFPKKLPAPSFSQSSPRKKNPSVASTSTSNTSTIKEESPRKRIERKSSCDKHELSGGFVSSGSIPSTNCVQKLEGTHSCEIPPAVIKPSPQTRDSWVKPQKRNSVRELKKNRIVPLLDSDTIKTKSNEMSTEKNEKEPRTRLWTHVTDPRSITTSEDTILKKNDSFSTSQFSPRCLYSPSSSLLSLYSTSSNSLLSSRFAHRHSVPFINVTKPEEPHIYDHLSPTLQEILNTQLEQQYKMKSLKNSERKLVLFK